MKTAPLTNLDRDFIANHFPGVYLVVVAAEALSEANGEREDVILTNQRGKSMDNADFAVDEAVHGVSRMVKLMQEGN